MLYLYIPFVFYWHVNATFCAKLLHWDDLKNNYLFSGAMTQRKKNYILDIKQMKEKIIILTHPHLSNVQKSNIK